MSSSALSSYLIRKASQLPQIQECSRINDTTKLIEFLKVANASELSECYAIKPTYFQTIWVPTIESASVVGAFLTKMPEEIYNSNEAPVMDTMLSLTTQVFFLFQNSEIALDIKNVVLNMIGAICTNFPQSGGQLDSINLSLLFPSSPTFNTILGTIGSESKLL